AVEVDHAGLPMEDLARIGELPQEIALEDLDEALRFLGRAPAPGKDAARAVQEDLAPRIGVHVRRSVGDDVGRHVEARVGRAGEGRAALPAQVELETALGRSAAIAWGRMLGRAA